MRKGFISISEASWQALEPNLPQCSGITVQRTTPHVSGDKLYRIIYFTYQVLQDVFQMGGFGALSKTAEGGHQQ
jgi:hypothetical protein